MKTTWISAKRWHPDCTRAENGFLGPCSAQVRLRQLADGKWPYEVTVTVDLPGRKPWFRRRGYKILNRASIRYDEFKRMAERYMALKCPTH